MTEHNVRRSALLGIGITLGFMLIAYVVGGMKIFHRSYGVTAVFSDASDIGSGDPVRVAGIDVGKVTSIKRLPHTVRISLDINQGVKLSQTTRASIRLRTLLGKKFIDLSDPGAGQRLRSGAVIPVSRTRPAVDVDQVINAIRGSVQRTDVSAINAVLRSFDQVMQGRTADVQRLLTDLSGLANTLVQRKGDIDRLLAASDKLSGAIDDRRQALSTSMDGLATALDALAARRAEISALVEGVKGLTERLTPLVQHNEGTLESIISDLKTTAGVLVKEKDRVGLALDQLPDAIAALRKITKEGSWINVYTVGFPGTPYLARPLDLGDNNGRNPAKTGGLPELWFRPPPHNASIDVAGINVDTGNHNQPPPEGYFGGP